MYRDYTILLKEFTINNLIEFLEVKLHDKDLQILQEKEKIVKTHEEYIHKKPKKLKEYFIIINSK